MRNTVLTICTALLTCFFLVSPVSASSIPAGAYSLSGVIVGNSSLSGTIILGSNGLATSATLTFADSIYGTPTFSNIASTGTSPSGNNQMADFAYICGSNGWVTLYYSSTLNSSGGIDLCESGSGCTVASSLQIYSSNYQAGLGGGSLTPAVTSPTPELSTGILLTTGLLLIAVVLIGRSRQELEDPSEAV